MAKLYIKRYEGGGEFTILNYWLEKRGHQQVEEDSLPKIGYIVLDDDAPICVGFLRRCEGNFGFLDGLATNPEVPGPIRHVAIDALVTKIIMKATEIGLTNLIAWSLDKGTLERSETHGFVKSPYTLITKDLKAVTICQ